MQSTTTNDHIIIKIDKGEKVIETITKFCETENIDNAFFSGIGAVKGLTCGYYELDEKKYYFTEYSNMVEVVSLTGNVMLKEGKPFIHVHGVFTDTTNTAFGGHIQEMTVGVAMEVMLTKLSTKVGRELDEDIGLFLLQCGG